MRPGGEMGHQHGVPSCAVQSDQQQRESVAQNCNRYCQGERHNLEGPNCAGCCIDSPRCYVQVCRAGHQEANGQYVILGFRFQSVAAGHLVGAHNQQCNAEEQQQECAEVERKHHMGNKPGDSDGTGSAAPGQMAAPSIQSATSHSVPWLDRKRAHRGQASCVSSPYDA